MDRIISAVPVSKGAEYVIKTTFGLFTVTAADFKKLALNVGDETDERIAEALENCDRKLKCIKKAFSYLSYGDLSKKKLYLKLTKHFDKKLSAYVASLMEERGYINENEQALRLAENLYRVSLYGAARIKSKLYQLLFSKEAIEYALNGLCTDDESDRKNIDVLISRKFSSGISGREEKQKAVAYLVRMGYTFDAVNDYFYSMQI